MNRSPQPDSRQLAAVSTAFDAVAAVYDGAWTDSRVGRRQREQVWHAIQGVFPADGRVLELGCGTGTDAAHLARSGLRVHATDASPEMLRMARSRVQRLGLCAAVSLELMPIEGLAEIRDPGPFDGIYSNFGAFNCIADPGAVSGELARLLRPGGKLVMCLLGRFCLWETAWFVLQGGMRKGFRRFSGMTEGSVASPGSSPPFRLYYPSISDLRRMLAEHFSLLTFRSIGALVPPSYAENWARRHPRILDGLAALDFHAGRLPVLRATGDHRLAIFARRGN